MAQPSDVCDGERAVMRGGVVKLYILGSCGVIADSAWLPCIIYQMLRYQKNGITKSQKEFKRKPIVVKGI